MGLRRETRWRAAWDRRHEGYGKHGVDVLFFVHGPAGTIALVIFTGWEPDTKPAHAPMAAALEYHGDAPQHEGQEVACESCNLRGGRPCYSDGSGLAADTAFDVLVSEGDEALWAHLEGRYADRFGAPEPDLEDDGITPEYLRDLADQFTYGDMGASDTDSMRIGRALRRLASRSEACP